ncbi:hypothetical protein DL769_010647 [Monosporascus sp. CRB-8-3]|nr:hypothetical protein DL769_010647 [Monosporascus sp. CRB-8-3]
MASNNDGEATLQSGRTSPSSQSNRNGDDSDHGDENQQPSNNFVDPGNHQAERPRTASASSWVTITSSASLPGTGAAEQHPPDHVTSRKWGGAEVLPALAKMKDMVKKKTKKVIEKLHQRQNNSTTTSPPASLSTRTDNSTVASTVASTPASLSTKTDNSTIASTPADAAALAAQVSQRAAVWHHPRCRPVEHPAVDAALSNFVRHLGEMERRGCPRAAEYGRKLADDVYEELEMISGRRRETASAAFWFRLLELYIYDEEDEEWGNG